MTGDDTLTLFFAFPEAVYRSRVVQTIHAPMRCGAVQCGARRVKTAIFYFFFLLFFFFPHMPTARRSSRTQAAFRHPWRFPKPSEPYKKNLRCLRTQLDIRFNEMFFCFDCFVFTCRNTKSGKTYYFLARRFPKPSGATTLIGRLLYTVPVPCVCVVISVYSHSIIRTQHPLPPSAAVGMGWFMPPR